MRFAVAVALVAKYDENQARDESGKWTSGGAGSGDAPNQEPATARELESEHGQAALPGLEAPALERGATDLGPEDLPLNEDLIDQTKDAAWEAYQRKQDYTEGQKPVTREQFETEAVAHIADKLKDAMPFIRIDPEIMLQVLDDGEFKSQHESQHSNGMFDPGYREDVEQQLFGDEWATAGYPIYGYLATDSDGEGKGYGVGHYGSVRVRLKDDVLDRTTFTLGDSLDHIMGKPMAPAPVREPHTGVGDSHNIFELDTIDEPPDEIYTEAQYHGGIKLGDIAEVVIDTTHWPSPELRDLKRRVGEAGIPVRLTGEVSLVGQAQLVKDALLKKAAAERHGIAIGRRGKQLLYVDHRGAQKGWVVNEFGEAGPVVTVESILARGYWKVIPRGLAFEDSRAVIAQKKFNENQERDAHGRWVDEGGTTGGSFQGALHELFAEADKRIAARAKHGKPHAWADLAKRIRKSIGLFFEDAIAVLKFDDNQLRDERGRWTAEGGAVLTGREGAQTITEVGMTSGRPEQQDPQVIARDMVETVAAMERAGVTGVHAHLGDGGWVDETGTVHAEPTWVLSYRGDDPAAIQAIARAAQRYNQQGVLLRKHANFDDRNAQPSVRWTFARPLTSSERTQLQDMAKAVGFGGWTYDPRKAQLGTTCVPAWGGEGKAFLVTARAFAAKLKASGLPVRRADLLAVIPTVMERRDYVSIAKDRAAAAAIARKGGGIGVFACAGADRGRGAGDAGAVLAGRERRGPDRGAVPGDQHEVAKGAPDQPRDDNGRFAETVGAVQGALTDELRSSKYRGQKNCLAGHCYVAAEAVFHLAGGKAAGLTPEFIRHEGEPHWYLRHASGAVIDPTAGQFKTPVPYAKGKGKGFLTREPSKRAQTVMARVRAKKFDENQPRDETGKWTDSGGGGTAATIREQQGQQRFAGMPHAPKVEPAASQLQTPTPTSSSSRDSADRPVIPDEWDLLTGDMQNEAQNKWAEHNRSAYIADEVENWKQDQGKADAIRWMRESEDQKAMDYRRDLLVENLVAYGVTQESADRAVGKFLDVYNNTALGEVLPETDDAWKLDKKSEEALQEYMQGGELVDPANDDAHRFWNSLEFDKENPESTGKWPPYAQSEDYSQQGKLFTGTAGDKDPRTWRDFAERVMTGYQSDLLNKADEEIGDAVQPPDFGVSDYMNEAWDNMSDRDKFREAERYLDRDIFRYGYDPNDGQVRGSAWSSSASSSSSTGTPVKAFIDDQGVRRVFDEERQRWVRETEAAAAAATAAELEAAGQGRLPGTRPKTEETLTGSPIHKVSTLGSIGVDEGVCKTYVADIGGIKCAVKPKWGEAGSRYRSHIGTGNDISRDVMAYEINEALGQVVDMPIAVERDVEAEAPNGRVLGRSLVTQWREGQTVDEYGGFSSLKQSEVHSMAFYDAVIGNEDRHGRNGQVDADGHLIAIDHNLAFPSANAGDSGNYTPIHRRMEAGRDDLSRDEVSRIEKLVGQRDKISARMHALDFEPEEIDALWQRVDYMHTTHKLFDMRHAF